MSVTMEQIKTLRTETGAGVLDAKNALVETGGDMEAAATILREKGLAKAAKKSERVAVEGHVASYVHGDPGRIGVLVEVNCETDFVARTDAFRDLVTEVAMQIAATNPMYPNESDIPEDVLAARRAELLEAAEAEQAGAKKPKPPEIMEKVIDGRLNKWLDEAVLARQPYIRNDEKLFGELITDAIAKIGENIVIRRFARFERGEQV